MIVTDVSKTLPSFETSVIIKQLRQSNVPEELNLQENTELLPHSVMMYEKFAEFIGYIISKLPF